MVQRHQSHCISVREMARAVASCTHTRVYVWNEDAAGDGFWSIVSLAPGHADNVREEPAHDGAVGGDEARASYMLGVQYRLTKAEMQFVHDRVVAYRKAHWQPPVAPHPPPLAPAPTSIGPTPAPAGRLATSRSAADRAPPTGGPAVAAGTAAGDDLVALLAGWQADFARLHGRQPRAEEVSAMVLNAYAKLSATSAA